MTNGFVQLGSPQPERGYQIRARRMAQAKERTGVVDKAAERTAVEDKAEERTQTGGISQAPESTTRVLSVIKVTPIASEVKYR